MGREREDRPLPADLEIQEGCDVIRTVLEDALGWSVEDRFKREANGVKELVRK